MEALQIEPTRVTPEVKYIADKKVLVIKGQSYPENAFKFYQPILQWVENLLSEDHSDVVVEVKFNMPYINTSSTKCIMMLLDTLEEAYEAGYNTTINWYYDADNESELECAQEFKEDLVLPFNLIAVK